MKPGGKRRKIDDTSPLPRLMNAVELKPPSAVLETLKLILRTVSRSRINSEIQVQVRRNLRRSRNSIEVCIT